MRSVVFYAFCWLLAPWPLAVQPTPSKTVPKPMRLRALAQFLQPSQIKRFDDDPNEMEMESRLEHAALEAGEPAVPMLRRALVGPGHARREVAASALAVIGGTEAVSALRQEYRRSHDLGIKTWLCFSMASTGSREDRAFLIYALQGPMFLPDGEPICQPIENAALSLGQLRAADAMPVLAAAERTDEGTVAAAARTALHWIRTAPPQTPQATGASEHDRLILVLFRCGIPRTDESPVFQETRSDRVWRFHDNVWTFAPQNTARVPPHTPYIGFDVYETTDHRRAIVSVGLSFGRLNGEGYDYFLRKTPKEWKVVGILSTWIS